MVRRHKGRMGATDLEKTKTVHSALRPHILAIKLTLVFRSLLTKALKTNKCKMESIKGSDLDQGCLRRQPS